ncbi:MAG: FliH/SctL family protein [Dehalococcoidales bacterium]|nr:FliH/SctL family protein [Dehalococcoidales bacterium]
MYSSSRIVRSARVSGRLVLPTPGPFPGEAAAGEPQPATEEEILRQAQSRAEATLAKARAEAEEIREKALVEAERLWESARVEGLDEGRLIGQQEVESRSAREVGSLRVLAESVASERDRILGASERELVSLALAIAGRVVQGQAAVDARVVEAIVSAALKRIGAQQRVRVRLNPADLEALTKSGLEPSADSFGRETEFVADEAIERGGCLLEVDGGTVDGRIGAQLAEAVRYFESLLMEA